MIDKNTTPDPNSPFAPGPLDAHKVATTNLVLDGMSQTEIDATLDGIEAALKEKRAGGQAKAAIEAIGGIVLPLLKTAAL